MRILVFGASGMLGSAMVRVLNEKDDLEVFGTIRSMEIKKYFPEKISANLRIVSDVLDYEGLVAVYDEIHPDVVINCISLSKQLIIESDPLLMIPVYALFPHQLARLCDEHNARLIHISSDGVFSGEKGAYIETDPSDAKDYYGATKFLGEVQSQHALTIRTSIIGHELTASNGLLSWFLSVEKSCKCFSSTIFSGFPTVVLAKIIRDIVLPRPELHGIYHIASNPISKCELLQLISEVYNKSVDLIPNDELKVDRSLNAEKFRAATGYIPPSWEKLIRIMYSYQ